MGGAACVLRALVIAPLAAALGGCGGRALVVPDDDRLLCGAAVEVPAGPPVTHPNRLASPAGAPIGALGGAVAALHAGIGALVVMPFTAAVGAAVGGACAAAGLAHPEAEADFAHRMVDVDPAIIAGALARALRERPACTHAPPSAATSRIALDRIESQQGCPLGWQSYWIAVTWRASTADAGRELAASVTRCDVRSGLEVDAWLAQPDAARAELRSAYARIGERIAAELVLPSRPASCTLRTDDRGALGPR